MKKQTAVEFFYSLTGKLRFISFDIIEKSKKYEIERMFNIYHEYQDYLDEQFKNQLGDQINILTFEQYYFEIYLNK